MRSVEDIMDANRLNEEVSFEELTLSLEVARRLLVFSSSAFGKIISDEKNTAESKMRAEEHWNMIRNALTSPPEKTLATKDRPGNSSLSERVTNSSRLIDSLINKESRGTHIQKSLKGVVEPSGDGDPDNIAIPFTTNGYSDKVIEGCAFCDYKATRKYRTLKCVVQDYAQAELAALLFFSIYHEEISNITTLFLGECPKCLGRLQNLAGLVYKNNKVLTSDLFTQVLKTPQVGDDFNT